MYVNASTNTCLTLDVCERERVCCFLFFFLKIAKSNSGQLQRQIIALPCDLQQKHQTNSGGNMHKWKHIALLIIK